MGLSSLLIILTSVQHTTANEAVQLFVIGITSGTPIETSKFCHRK